VPLHAPLATQAVAFVLVHVSIELPFALIEAGEADQATVRALAGDHGLTFLDEPLQELRQRHGLVAP
jgi:hypothetical protein